MSDIDELLERARQLHARVLGINISGPGWSGNVRDGFIFNPSENVIAGPVVPVTIIPTPQNCTFDATLVCDSISASRTKCGYTECSGFESTPPKYYLHKTDNWVRSDSRPATSCTSSWGFTTTTDNVVDEDGNCVDTVTCSGSGTITDNTGTFNFSWVSNGSNGCVATNAGLAFCTSACLTPDSGGCTSATVSVRTCSSHPGPFDVDLTETITISNEYTTADLISNTEGALPDYDDDFNDSCSASYDLSDDETSLTIQDFRYKFTFDAAAHSCILRWIERFTPEVGDVVDTPRSFSVTAGMTETTVFTVVHPSENGEITIVYPV